MKVESESEKSNRAITNKIMQINLFNSFAAEYFFNEYCQSKSTRYNTRTLLYNYGITLKFNRANVSQEFKSIKFKY